MASPLTPGLTPGSNSGWECVCVCVRVTVQVCVNQATPPPKKMRPSKWCSRAADRWGGVNCSDVLSYQYALSDDRVLVRICSSNKDFPSELTWPTRKRVKKLWKEKQVQLRRFSVVSSDWRRSAACISALSVCLRVQARCLPSQHLHRLALGFAKQVVLSWKRELSLEKQIKIFPNPRVDLSLYFLQCR